VTFEYKIAFLIPVVFIICKLLCPPKSESLIFPNASFFNKTKYKIPILEFLIITLLSISLASPVKTEIYQNTKKGYDIVTVLDTSGSMGEYNKLENAKAIVKNFAKKRKNDRLGLVIFGNIAYIASPLTYDKKVFNSILERIFVNIAGGKTAMYDALFLSSNLFKGKNKKIIILITDGIDNASITPLDVVLKKLTKEKIKVYAIGIGPDIDSNILKTIADKTKGKFFHITNLNQLKEVFKAIDKNEKNIIENKTVVTTYYYKYPLTAALILMSVFLLKYRRNLWSF
jgi:Ca-activated chloride channel family protein